MKKLLFLIMLVMLAVPVFAGPEVVVQANQDVITLDETASFRLLVSSKMDADEYRLYYSGVEWDVPPQTFELEKGSTTVLDVQARPLYVTPGQHAILINIKSKTTGEITKVTLLVNVKSREASSYLPSVGLRIEMPASVKPGEEFPVTLTLSNKNPLRLEDLQINIDSDYFSSTKTLTLEPTTKTESSSAVVEDTFSVDYSVPPQDGRVIFRLVYKNETVALYQKTLVIERFDPAFSAESSIEKGFLKKVETVTISNVGNLEKTDDYKRALPLFKSLVTSTDPDASVLKENNERYLRWQLSLAPGESTMVKITTNYRLILLLFIIAILGVAIYFALRSPLNIAKRAEVIKTEEGGISMLKVMLVIKNISGKPIHDVKLYDRIPSLADYYKEEQVGTLSPVSVNKSEQKGTLLKYEINTLEPFEERIIMYKIRTQLNILGGLTLPSVQGRFKSDRGRNRITKSSAFKLLQ